MTLLLFKRTRLETEAVLKPEEHLPPVFLGPLLPLKEITAMHLSQ